MKIKKTIYIETYGCSLNLSDSEVMAGLLQNANYDIVASEDGADLVIINSCTVKDKTYRNFVKRLAELKGKKRLLIAGCIPAPYAHTNLLNDLSYMGTDNIGEIVEVVNQVLDGQKVQRLGAKTVRKVESPKLRRNPVIEILPICQGCVGKCSYCQTRLARGELRSYPLAEIVRQAECALEQGVKEIWLTAQDTGAYGKDMGSSLPQLLNSLIAIKSDFRLRLGMANPNHILTFLDELLEVFHSEKIFKFLHLPLQAGSNKILKLMNRLHTVEQFAQICARFSAEFERLSIATDIICGFPTETEEEFEQSLEVLSRIKPAVVNRSRYSRRPFTPAAEMEQLPIKTIAERSQRLTRLVEQISAENNKAWIGWQGEVLLDEQRKPGSLLGRNFAYKPIVVKTENNLTDSKLGNMVRVTVTQATTYHLLGQSNQ